MASRSTAILKTFHLCLELEAARWIQTQIVPSYDLQYILRGTF